MARIVVDPVSRIEGHLRIEANLDGGKITDAWSSGTMFRGIEMILEGRDPREAWIWTQRICGVCTVVHAIASVRAVEDALQIEAIVDFEQAVGDRVPVGEELVVAGDAEVEGLADAGQNLGAAGRSAGAGG